ncbi:MAG: phosphate ABC transporter permease subunit PstC [Alphaproteobacteria bacterium]|nr:phosphate ABC transporter permease subunit PstC [Alphaproteobacteria bacterium]
MFNFYLLVVILLISFLFFFIGLKEAKKLRLVYKNNLHSLPHYYGFYALLASLLPSLGIYFLMTIGDDFLFSHMIKSYIPDEVTNAKDYNFLIALAQINNSVEGLIFGTPPQWVTDAAELWKSWVQTSNIIVASLCLLTSIASGYYGFLKINQNFRSRNAVEKIIMTLLAASSVIAIFTTIAIIFSVVFESVRFFALIPIDEFLFGTVWNPQFEGAERAGSGQQGLSQYGSIPLFAGTFLISFIALCVSVPVGLFSAIYLSEYASSKERALLKPLLEILAGVPTVVYGFFAALTVAPFLRTTGSMLGLDVASESALAAGLVMGIMIIPFISSLSDDVINAVPQSLRDAGYGLGSTKNETVLKIVLPAALPGVVASIILAVSRAVGETMIVVMAAGLAANLTANPLEAVTTVTSQIVTILVGDQEFESAKTLSAFALALTLIIITLCMNFYALHIVKKYREQYE